MPKPFHELSLIEKFEAARGIVENWDLTPEEKSWLIAPDITSESITTTKPETEDYKNLSTRFEAIAKIEAFKAFARWFSPTDYLLEEQKAYQNIRPIDMFKNDDCEGIRSLINDLDSAAL